ncbi:YibE/F family protein [Tessaracoccus caeni]|uniref:YibE/F family protein n=1 Tax=Tessaracoccus caeni TaxID=3031239 RepID=UPI0023DA89D1|nr:YibE/F family protein [Tessaracoccus caeni]MDF1488154.1 YibE/F family protein [Tessaracoccus caeni]
MGHSHGNHDDLDAVEVGTQARNALIAFLAVVGALAVAGLIWLWPSAAEMEATTFVMAEAPGVTRVDATIVSLDGPCGEQAEALGCEKATIELDSGERVTIDLTGATTQAGLRSGDSVQVMAIPTDDGTIYSYAGTNRLPVLIALGALFLVAVFAVARWKGLFAIVGLIVAGWVLVGFILPAIIVGRPGMAVALAGSTAIMFVVLYVAHGISIRTSTALAGTLLGLAVTTGLGMAAVKLARLSGFADENEFDLAQLAGGIDFQELLMVGIIIGGLGVLNDVTITQSSAVWELRAAAPHYTRRQIFAAGMRIGRDHIASTIYTIVFAYAGSALTVLLLIYFIQSDVVSLFGRELFAGELVRTLASAIGLVLSVPITTGIAALTVAPARHHAL